MTSYELGFPVRRVYSWTRFGNILRLLLHTIHSHLLHQMILYSLYCFLELVILEQQLNVDGGLALFTFSL
jgi:hypothetical protein